MKTNRPTNVHRARASFVSALITAILFASFVSSAFAGAVSVNGSCQSGNCTTPDTLASGGAVSAPVSVIFTLPNTDQFLIQGNLSGSDTGGTSWSITGGRTTITYLGNTTGTPSSADTLTVDLLQNVQNSGVTTGTFGEATYGAFGSGFGTGSSASTSLLIGGNSLGQLGPFLPTTSLFSKTLTGIKISGLGNPTLLDVRYSVSFAAGSTAGAFVIFSDAPVSLPLGAAISVNGTCQIGNCTTPDTVDANGSLTTPFNFTYTFANTDRYKIEGSSPASNKGGTTFSTAGTQLAATYLGNSTGSASGTDTLTIDLSQNFQYSSSVTAGSFSEQAFGTFGGGIAQSGSSASFQVFLGANGLPVLGPYAPSSTPFSSALTTQTISGLADPELYKIRSTLSFGSGSNPGAFIILGTVPINQPPSITSGGVVPVYSSATTVQPGEWISIYGANVAAATNTWNGDFPTSLGGVNVTIDSKPAYLWIVSPTQINLQVPDDTATGQVNVAVTTPGGSFTSSVTLAKYAPSFTLLNGKYPAAIVGTPGALGTTGGGYDIIGPVGALPYPSRPVKAGETVILYGVGFGPTTPSVLAGQLYSGAANCTTLPQVSIGGVNATVSFAGIVEAGLYQLNVIVPNVGTGDQPLKASIGGVSTQSNVFLTLQ